MQNLQSETEEIVNNDQKNHACPWKVVGAVSVGWTPWGEGFIGAFKKTLKISNKQKVFQNQLFVPEKYQLIKTKQQLPDRHHRYRSCCCRRHLGAQIGVRGGFHKGVVFWTSALWLTQTNTSYTCDSLSWPSCGILCCLSIAFFQIPKQAYAAPSHSCWHCGCRHQNSADASLEHQEWQHKAKQSIEMSPSLPSPCVQHSFKLKKSPTQQKISTMFILKGGNSPQRQRGGIFGGKKCFVKCKWTRIVGLSMWYHLHKLIWIDYIWW